MSNDFTFKDECKKRYNKRVEEYLSDFPKEKNVDKGCVYFIGELSPVRASETKASIMLDFIDNLKDKDNYKHLEMMLEHYKYQKKYENNYEAFRYIKIGYSANVKNRLKDLQVASPRELILIGTINNVDQSFEKDLHKYLKTLIYGCNVMGEWFDFSLVKYHVRNWLYPFTKHYYFKDGFYDEEQDLLRALYIDTYDYRQFLDTPTKPKDLPRKELDWIKSNAYQFSKGLTTANKTHLDLFGDIIRKDDDYFKISNSYDHRDALSCVSLIKLVKILKETGIKSNMQSLKTIVKDVYNQSGPEELARHFGFRYDFFSN